MVRSGSSGLKQCSSGCCHALPLRIRIGGRSTGTDGIADGNVHVEYPASSPWAIGCGGTRIDTTGNTINSEVVWNENGSGTGGGISDRFAVPVFQQGTSLPANVSTGKKGRGVPDVAGDAAVSSGYLIVIRGNTQVVGGTSAVAPLWAGLTALINQATTYPSGFFLPMLYDNPQLLRVITQGNNKPVNSNLGYTAGNQWSACTGLGVPIRSLIQAFLATKLTLKSFGRNADAGGWQVDQHPRLVIDLTRDRRRDIVGFGDRGVWVALGNGNGTFQAPQLTLKSFGRNADAGGWQVDQHLRLVTDLTRDSRADIVGFGDRGVWVALGNGNGTFQAPQLTLESFGRNADAGGWRLTSTSAW